MKFTELLEALIAGRKNGSAPRGIMRYTGKLEGRHLALELGLEVPELWSQHGLDWCAEPPWRGCVIKPTSSSNSRGVLPLERRGDRWRSLLGDGEDQWRNWWMWSLQEHERHRSLGVDPYPQHWIVEELVIRDSGDRLLLPYDWKVYCLGGVAIWVNQVDKTSSRDATTYRTRHWWVDTYGVRPAEERIIEQPRLEAELPPPRQGEKLLRAAERIARFTYDDCGSPFVRVDLYESDRGQVFFGEITPHPSGGREVYNDAADAKIGALWGELT